MYARVSTNRDQTVENQLLALRDWADAQRHDVVAEYTDEGISGSKGRDKRPGLDDMVRDATLGRLDMIATTSLDRLGRSMKHLVQLFGELEALHVGLFIRNLALDTSTPTGRLMFNVMGSFAEFERELIVERTLLGLERARRAGKKLGRPTVPQYIERRIETLLQAGTSCCKTARMAGVSKPVVYRIRDALRA